MVDCRKSLSPLSHGGTSQAERALPGLSDDHVKIDENDYTDWIVFASEFSKYIAYYESEGGEAFTGWQAFFSRDISALLGSFAIQDIADYRQELSRRFAYLRDDDNAPGNPVIEDALKRNLSEAFAAVVTLARAMDVYHLQLPEGSPEGSPDASGFKATLGTSIATKLAPALRRLLAYLKGAQALGLYVPVVLSDWRVLNTDLDDALAVASASGSLSKDWWSAAEPDYGALAPDSSVFLGVSTYERVSHAANHFLFNSAFDGFTQGYARLIDDAGAALAQTLDSYDGHQPHYALFLAFLKLFRTARDKLNEVTWKHLDFYYRDVLRLAPRPPQPDQVHLLAELRKTRGTAALPEGALFKADKDSQRKDRFYALSSETTFNRAKVVSLMAVYRAEGSDERLPSELRGSGRIFAAPVINSSDGIGGELTNEMGDWHPFLNANLNDSGTIDTIAMPAADIGFGVSSHYLFLAEGSRHINLIVKNSVNFFGFDAAKLRCKLSHEKGWFEKAVTDIGPKPLTDDTGDTCLRVTLDANDPPVTAVDHKIHGTGFEAGIPAAQFILHNESGVTCGYDDLKDVRVQAVQLEVVVGNTEATAYQNDGIRQLSLSGKDGGLDAAKPFMPWGAAPRADVPFVLGSAEMFGKKGERTAFNLDIAWAGRPSSLSSPAGAKLQFLQGGSWVDAIAVASICKASTQRTFTSPVNIPQGAAIDDAGTGVSHDATSRAGFMRLVLDGDFGHAGYPADYLQYTLEYNKWVQDEKDLTDPEVPTAPPEPYVPVIDAISCHYEAVSDVVDLGVLDSGGRPVRFYHIGPFGTAEQSLPPQGSSKHWLLPQFRVPGEADHAGEWYIGLEDLAARQSVNLLVQVLEGSTLPLLSKPVEHVKWSYWAANHWVPFETSEVSDGTRQLIQSGIVSFAIPDGATTDQGVMPHGKLWLRAAVTQGVGAVARVLAVQAQALHVTFKDKGNAPDAMDQPLAAGTVKKLRDADSAFKSFAQPFTSFGGRPRERDAAFYLRSSERLRHKDRAITIWDYERLVLAAFPEIHRVKCLHHTRIEDNPDASLAIHNENAPGYVSVITLPNLEGRNDTEVLKPYTHQSVLTSMQTFLTERITGQLSAAASGPRVCVCNPLFEEIVLELKLQLADGYDDSTYYRNLLADEITRFLSPWAFSAGAEARFGGRIVKSTLIDYIDERPYVDFVTDVSMRHRPEGGTLSDDMEVVEASTSRSILVSAPSSEHKVHPYEEAP